jgi:transposase
MTAPRAGDAFHLDLDGTVIAGRYIEVDPPHRLVIGWDRQGADKPTPTPTCIEITLTPTGNGTTVKVQLSGLNAADTAFHQQLWARHLDRIAAAFARAEPGASGETVLDVPATLAARVRLLGSGKSNKNDPNDALSVAVAALRAPRLAPVERADLGVVLRLLAKRNVDLGRTRNRVACRLHALLAELVPGGMTGEIYVSSAQAMLAKVRPIDPVTAARRDLALEHLDDLRRLDEQTKASKKRIATAVTASGTTLVELFGVGPVVACMVIGYTGDVRRFATRHAYAMYNGTAPIDVSSGGRITRRLNRRGNRQLNHAIHIAAVTQLRHAHSEGGVYFDRKVAEGKTKKEALRSLKRRISDAVYRQLLLDVAR